MLDSVESTGLSLRFSTTLIDERRQVDLGPALRGMCIYIV